MPPKRKKEIPIIPKDSATVRSRNDAGPSQSRGTKLHGSWDAYKDMHGRTYYFNTITGISQWEFPKFQPYLAECSSEPDSDMYQDLEDFNDEYPPFDEDEDSLAIQAALLNSQAVFETNAQEIQQLETQRNVAIQQNQLAQLAAYRLARSINDSIRETIRQTVRDAVKEAMEDM
uniref:WW domain-containing protein n=1 Tax=viral metagenome TaxID=1070528 RepID=A0A6C0H371_9ZZZZ